MSNNVKTNKLLNKTTLILFVLLFAVIGTYLVFNSMAATQTCTTTLSAGANVSSAIQNAGSGSTICLRGGNYSGFRIAKEYTNKTSYVTVTSYAGELATFTSALTFDNAKYIRLENLKIIGGLNFVPAGTNIEVKSNEITGVVGIYMYGDYRSSTSGCPCTVSNVNIENNNIHDIDYTGTQGPGGGVGITGVGDTFNVTVKNNTIKSTASDYIQSGMIHDWNVEGNTFLGPSLQYPNHPTDHQDLWQIFGCNENCYDEGTLIYNITFNNNIARDTGTAESLLFQTAYFRNVSVQNNLFDHDARGYSIMLYNTDGLIFRNNTIVGSGWGSIFRDGCLDEAEYDKLHGTKVALTCVKGKNYQVDHNIFDTLYEDGGGVDTTTNDGPALGLAGDVSNWGVFDYNVSTDNTAGGTNSVRNWTASFVNEIDYKPKNLTLAAGYNSVASPPPTPTLPGDVDGNKVVDIDDLSLLLINWKKNYPQADFVKDNIIDIDDLSILLVNWGKKLP